ncbi:Endonuclease MutS2 [bacterium HR39]|nr:Endonuclease MutS2 [bacterium HR39]
MRDPRTRPHVRRPTEKELALWRAFVRAVRPLHAHRRPEPSESGAEAPPSAPQAGETPPAEAAAPAGRATARPQSVRRAHMPPPRGPEAFDPQSPAGIDRRTWQRLRRGQLAIEAVLDLHGHTREQAFAALQQFLERERGRGARCVLVITGRGSPRGGVLRRELPRWLETPALRSLVLGFAPARIEHGGEGAFYVLLRRRRERRG